MPRTKLPVSPTVARLMRRKPCSTEPSKGDVDLLMSCWAEDDEIVCVHPGGSRLMGPPQSVCV